VPDDRGNRLAIEKIAHAKTEFSQKSSAPLIDEGSWLRDLSQCSG